MHSPQPPPGPPRRDPKVYADGASLPDAAAEPGQISSATCLLAALRRATDFHLRGDYEAAERRLQAVLRLDPELPQAHHHLAVVYHAQGRYSAALERLEAAVALDPNLPGSEDRLEAYRFDAAVHSPEAPDGTEGPEASAA